VPDTRHDDMVDPLVRALAGLSGQHADRRSARRFRAARRGCHHLPEPTAHHRDAAFREQPADLRCPLLVLGTAADDGHLNPGHASMVEDRLWRLARHAAAP
jgi:hypothetical protein